MVFIKLWLIGSVVAGLGVEVFFWFVIEGIIGRVVAAEGMLV